jgi:hypothetical protein
MSQTQQIIASPALAVITQNSPKLTMIYGSQTQTILMANVKYFSAGQFVKVINVMPTHIVNILDSNYYFIGVLAPNSSAILTNVNINGGILGQFAVGTISDGWYFEPCNPPTQQTAIWFASASTLGSGNTLFMDYTFPRSMVIENTAGGTPTVILPSCQTLAIGTSYRFTINGPGGSVTFKTSDSFTVPGTYGPNSDMTATCVVASHMGLSSWNFQQSNPQAPSSPTFQSVLNVLIQIGMALLTFVAPEVGLEVEAVAAVAEESVAQATVEAAVSGIQAWALPEVAAGGEAGFTSVTFANGFSPLTQMGDSVYQSAQNLAQVALSPSVQQDAIDLVSQYQSAASDTAAFNHAQLVEGGTTTNPNLNAFSDFYEITNSQTTGSLVANTTSFPELLTTDQINAQVYANALDAYSALNPPSALSQILSQAQQAATNALARANGYLQAGLGFI